MLNGSRVRSKLPSLHSLANFPITPQPPAKYLETLHSWDQRNLEAFWSWYDVPWSRSDKERRSSHWWSLCLPSRGSVLPNAHRLHTISLHGPPPNQSKIYQSSKGQTSWVSIQPRYLHQEWRGLGHRGSCKLICMAILATLTWYGLLAPRSLESWLPALLGSFLLPLPIENST